MFFAKMLARIASMSVLVAGSLLMSNRSFATITTNCADQCHAQEIACLESCGTNLPCKDSCKEGSPVASIHALASNFNPKVCGFENAWQLRE